MEKIIAIMGSCALAITACHCLASEVKQGYLSKDGEESYLGNLSVKVTYTPTNANELKWEASATPNAPTIVNVVHHSYWYLSENPRLAINDHALMLAALHFLPTDIGLILTGVIAPVAGTPMDFTKPRVIDERLDADTEAMKLGGGYDHCWVLDDGTGLRLAARLKHPASGRVMAISTEQPAIQFYGGNFLNGTVTGKGDLKYAKRTALCLESEGFPDSPNQASFPSPVLSPSQTYQHRMTHKFIAQ